MPTKLTAETLIALSVPERKALISQQASTIDITNIDLFFYHCSVFRSDKIDKR